jgi:hypothetical protein
MTTRNFRVKNGLTVGDIEISASAGTITGLSTAAPSADGDTANKKYVDDQINAISTTSITTDSNATNATVSGTGASGTLTITANSNTEITVTDSGMQLGGSGARVNSILDEDAMGSDSATALATQQSIKAYVDAQVTASDLDFQGDSGGALSIDLDSEVLDIAGGTGIDTTGSGNTLTVAIDSTVATLAGTQTFTNKTFDANGTGNSISNIEVADFAGSAIINVSETLASNDSDTALVTAGAIIDYVDAQDANIASDTLTLTNKTFDADGTGNSLSNIDAGNLKSGFLKDEDNMASNSATSVASQQSIKAYVDAEDANIASDTLTFTNKTFDANGTGNSITNIDAGNLLSGFLKDEDNMASNSATSVASQQSIKAYVDTEIGNISSTTLTAGNTTAVVSDSGSDGAFTVTADGNTELVVNDTSATFSGNVVVSGNLTVNGTTTTVATTNTTVSDSLIEYGNGTTGSPSNDAGIVIERGDSNNAFIGFDESEDKFRVGTGTFTGASTGNLTITTGTLLANIEGNVTGNVTGAVTGNADTATALATARNIGGVSFDGTANINLPGVNTSGNQDTSGNAATATTLETARNIGGVSFNGSANINLPGVNTAGNQDTSGTAAIATTVTVADESSDTSCNVIFTTAASGNLAPKSGTNLTFNSSTGNLTATTFTGDLTGNVTGNTSGSSGSCTGNSATATESTNVTVTANNATNETVYLTFVDGATGTQGIETDTGLSYNPSTNVLSTTASQAQYADVAERFEADAPMEIGSVVEVGGTAEITEATSEMSQDVFGVISDKPAYMMNAGAGDNNTHPFVAMTGRTPVRVTGVVNKGQRLVTSSIKGCARAVAQGESISPFNVIGRALESNTDAGIKLVNCAVRTNN